MNQVYALGPSQAPNPQPDVFCTPHPAGKRIDVRRAGRPRGVGPVQAAAGPEPAGAERGGPPAPGADADSVEVVVRPGSACRWR